MGLPALTSIAGTAMQALGQYQAGEEAAAVAKYNAQVKAREAQAVEQRTMIAQRKQARAAARRMSELRAGLSASGAVTTAGAPLQIIGEQAKQSELENLEMGYEGTTEAKKLRSEAAMIKKQGKAARRASRIGAGTTLLTGFSKTFV